MACFIELTKGQRALVDDCDYDALMQIGSWCYSSSGYGVHYFRDEQGKRKTLYMHRFIYYRILGNQHLPAGMQCDHRNWNRIDNRRSNLRLATRSQNQAHKGRPTNNTSQYKGVSFNGGKWEARIRHEGKRIHLGRFDDPVEAAWMYDAATKLLNQEFAGPNFPKQPTPPHIEVQLRYVLSKRGLK
jgi:hypothetical protein